MTAAATPTTPWENPLTPNKRLRQLYTTMAELRLLETHLAASRRSKPIVTPRNEEACRVSTALSLLPADLASDPTASIATSFIRGTKLTDLNKTSNTRLPISGNTTTRLHLAIGAALALASKKKSPIVLAYVYPTDLSISEWKPILRLAAAHAAPVIFVVLPSDNPAKKPGQLAHSATACGVPGIPVDAADAVALYRVAQESTLRSRAGGGPVLMECIPFQLPGTRTPPSDPIANMRESLIHRKLADEAWFESVPKRFATRLKAAGL